MKLVLSEPVAVAVGPDARYASWGPFQFPDIVQNDSGRMYYLFNDNPDSEKSYGSGRRVFFSDDEGLHWQETDYTSCRGDLGIKLPSGERLRECVPPSLPLDQLQGQLPEPLILQTKKLNNRIYRMEEVHCCEDTWFFIRTTPEHPEGVKEKVRLDWPGMLIRSCRGVLVQPSPRGRIRVAPDGTLWMPHYYFAGETESGESVPYLCNYLFRSEDHGHSWSLVHKLLYQPEYFDYPNAELLEGFGENDIGFAPDGSLIRLIRAGNCNQPPFLGPCCITRSTDNGQHWSAPAIFDDHGVWPCLLTLPCGVMLASYGRPGVSVRASRDPSGLVWEDPVEIVHAEPQSAHTAGTILEKATCGYTNLLPLGERKAALVYSDFTRKDDHGIPRKTMMFRTITIEGESC